MMTFDRLCVWVLIESLESRAGTWHLGPASRASRWTRTRQQQRVPHHTLYNMYASKKELTDLASELHLKKNDLFIVSIILREKKKSQLSFFECLSTLGPKLLTDFTHRYYSSYIFQYIPRGG